MTERKFNCWLWIFECNGSTPPSSPPPLSVFFFPSSPSSHSYAFSTSRTFSYLISLRGSFASFFVFKAQSELKNHILEEALSDLDTLGLIRNCLKVDKKEIRDQELAMFRFQLLIALIFVLKGNASVSKNETVLLGSGQMIDSIAPYYDVANTIMSLGQHHRWRR